jgi:hypothetical protein
MALAKILAVEVFPVPREPQKRYAWAIRLLITWFLNVPMIALCPTTWEKSFGLHSR